MWKLLLASIALLCATSVTANPNNCCKNPSSVINNGKCSDGTNITGVTCKHRYLVVPEDQYDNFSINAAGELILIETPPIAPERFCVTKQENSDEPVVLICFEEMEESNRSAEYTLRAVCSALSVLFLVMTLVVYCLVPTLRDLQGRCLMNLITGLSIAMLLLGILQIQQVNTSEVCYGMGYALYVAFLVTFAWLNVVSFNIWQTTVIPTSLGTPKQWEMIYIAYGYGLPFIFLITAITGHHAEGNHIRPGIGEKSCWFSSRHSMWAYFYGPVAVMLLLNVILYVFTIKQLWSDSRSAFPSIKLKSLRYKCLLYIKLFFIMGMTWIFEILSYAFNNQNNFLDYVWMVTDFINGMQGVLIFIILIAFRKRALKGLAARNLGCFTLPIQWRTLHDEECDDLIEEEKLASEHPHQEKIEHAKETPSVV